MAEQSLPPDNTGFQEDLNKDSWEHDAHTPSLLSRMVAEACGTFVLVVIGVGTGLYLQAGNNGTIAVGFAFGLTVLAVIVAIGKISGAHINPAVTVGAWLSGRFPAKDIGPYILAQVVGGAAGGGVLYLFALGSPQFGDARSQLGNVSHGFEAHSPEQFGLLAGFTAEVLATGLLMTVILMSTSTKAVKAQAPFAIGLALTALVVWTIPFTNGALNPARATATAIYADVWAVEQLWVFWLAPIIGAAIVGLLYRVFGPEEDFDRTYLADVPVVEEQPPT